MSNLMSCRVETNQPARSTDSYVVLLFFKIPHMTTVLKEPLGVAALFSYGVDGSNHVDVFHPGTRKTPARRRQAESFEMCSYTGGHSEVFSLVCLQSIARIFHKRLFTRLCEWCSESASVLEPGKKWKYIRDFSEENKKDVISLWLFERSSTNAISSKKKKSVNVPLRVCVCVFSISRPGSEPSY